MNALDFYTQLRRHLLTTMQPSRARELALERLEESALWASAAEMRIVSPIEQAGRAKVGPRS
jgi:hypothetical protein